MNEIFKLSIKDVSIHDEALATPRMTEDQYESLKQDIIENGQIDPVLLYRGKIVDGRHRYLILCELNSDTILATKMNNNSTINDIRKVVRSRETRRHETPTQLAISALRYLANNVDKLTQAEVSKKFGVSSKTIGVARKISKDFGREDILDHLFNGGTVNIGNDYMPYNTDSLKTIVNWLDEAKAKQVTSKIGIEARTELTESENIMISQVMFAIKNESKFFIEELASRLYSAVKEQN